MDTLERVRSLFQKNYDFPVERLQPEANIESIGLDSLDKIEFLFDLEKEFNVKIPIAKLRLPPSRILSASLRGWFMNKTDSVAAVMARIDK